MTTRSTTALTTCGELAQKLLAEYQRGVRNASAEPDKQDDRRKTPRRSFQCWQFIADYDGRNLPPQKDFRLRLCQDISRGGLSFLTEDRPRTLDLVIALGATPFLFFHVRVVRSTRRSELRGHPLQVACQFIKRITR